MSPNGPAPGDGLLARVLVPVANPEDARATAASLDAYAPGEVILLYVVEKGEGVPDKTPVEQSEQEAAESFEAFRETFPEVETELAYDRDVVEAIQDVATEIDASAIVFRPRETGRLRRFLSGDRTLSLVTESDHPVVALPDA